MLHITNSQFAPLLLILSWLIVDPCVTQEQYQIYALYRHNYHRKGHQAGDLCLDLELSVTAQICAEYYARVKNDIDHTCPNKTKSGENLWMGRKAGDPAATFGDPIGSSENATDAWYNEIEDYDFQTGKPKPQNPLAVIGHFTALIWKASKRVGFGFYSFSDPSNSTGDVRAVLVALYRPSGNVNLKEYYIENVLPYVGGGVNGSGFLCNNDTGTGTDKKKGSGERGEISAALLITCFLITNWTIFKIHKPQ